MNSLSPITRNLLIANVVCYLLQLLAGSLHIDLTDLFGLHFVLADDFRVWQLVSYMFLHGSLTHLFFNMFSLWMFGGLIERTLGAKRFLTYWMVCGIGAGICQEFWQTGQYFVEGLNNYPMVNTGSAIISMGDYLNLWTTIGASGACYGVLLAFGMLFPNERIMLLLPPIPMKAKYFVAGYAAIELISAYASNDNVAHFAHLGGMLFGWLLLRYWRTSRSRRPAANGWTRWNEPPRTPSLWERITSRLRNRRTEQPGNAHHTATRQNDYDYNIRRRQEEQRMDELLDNRATPASRRRRNKSSSASVGDKHRHFPFHLYLPFISPVCFPKSLPFFLGLPYCSFGPVPPLRMPTRRNGGACRASSACVSPSVWPPWWVWAWYACFSNPVWHG